MRLKQNGMEEDLFLLYCYMLDDRCGVHSVKRQDDGSYLIRLTQMFESISSYQITLRLHPRY